MTGAAGRIAQRENPNNAPTIPHGVYDGRADVQGSAELIGTAAFWDGVCDRGGANDGTEAAVRDDPNGDHYAAFLVLDDNTRDQAGEFAEFTKDVL